MPYFVVLQSGEVLAPQDPLYSGDWPFQHDRLLRQHHIPDNELIPQFVKCQVLPPRGDWLAPFCEWNFYVKQDKLPPWFSRPWCLDCCQDALKQWAKTHVFSDGEHEMNLGEALGVFLGNASVRIWKMLEGELHFYENAKCFGLERIITRDIRINGDLFKIIARHRDYVETRPWFGGW
jgi:hypothetical protein